MPASTGTKSLTSDDYAWVGSTGGSWSSASNWDDTTTGTNPALYVPGALTAVTIAGPIGSTYEVISGGGSAASLGLTGNVSLGGGYTVGRVLNVGNSTAPTASSLALVMSGTIAAGSVNVTYGTLSLAAATSLSSTGLITVGIGGTVNLATGAALSTSDALLVDAGTLTDTGGTVSIGGGFTIGTLATTTGMQTATVAVDAGGTLAIGGAITGASGYIAVSGTGSKLITSGTLIATGGAELVSLGGFMQLGEVVFNAPVAASRIANWFPYLWLVDTTATIEIGNTGNAAVGAITVDAGKTITVNTTAALEGALVDNGTVTVTSGTLTQGGNLSGSGIVQIGKNATLVLSGTAATTNTIAFLDTGAVLSIGSGLNGTKAVGATLTGFQTGDSLILATQVSAATYTAGAAGSPGTLVLSNGATTVETLRLAGDFTGKSFFVSPTTSNGASISLIDQPGIPAPDLLFDRAYYLSRNPDVATAGIDPYQHFLAHGWKEGRDPSSLFSTSYYLAHNPDVAAVGIDPLLHFESYGWHEGRNPDALFDTNYYLAQNPDVAKAGVDPLLHFQASGAQEGRDPSLVFSDAKYLAANPDVAAAGVDPLAHYLAYGQSEGRMAFLSGGTAAADPLVDAAYYDKQLGATLIPTDAAGQRQAAASYDATGWQKGLNPDAFFDTAYYLSHNPDVAAAHLDPLQHYEQFGWHEGRDPSAQFSTAKYLAAYSDVKAAGVDPLLHYVEYGKGEGRAAFAI